MINKKKMIIAIIFLTLIIIFLIVYKKVIKNNYEVDPPTPAPIVDKTNFDFKVISETNNLVKKQNYLVSPLSMGYALSMLNEGAAGNTKTEIDNLLNGYKLPNIGNVKNKIGIANLIFMRTKYKNDISPKYIDTLKQNYSSDVMFDPFETPDKANEWVSKKTFKMINDAIDNISEDFVLGLANTIAIDVEWRSKFKCNDTTKKEFTKVNGKKMDTAMMKGENDVYYIENENAKGIIKDYNIYDTKTNEVVYEENEDTIALEYIAILPKNIEDYLKKFNEKEFKQLLESKKESDSKTDIEYYLPKYTYDFTYNDFDKMLKNLGMKDAFIGGKANFKNMVTKESGLELFVSKSIHKTHIELSENGTKAAAVTIFMMDKNAIQIDPKEKITIEFNQPFIYIIKEKNSDNIWFYGTVFEPLKWEENTNICEIE